MDLNKNAGEVDLSIGGLASLRLVDLNSRAIWDNLDKMTASSLPSASGSKSISQKCCDEFKSLASQRLVDLNLR